MAITAFVVAALLAQGAPRVQIHDVKVGTGPAVRVGDYVAADYTGKLTSGKQFDSSKGRKPFKFMVGAGEVISGWDLGFIGMQQGGMRTLTIPPALGYGAQGSPPEIPGNSTLVFDVELVKLLRSKVVTTKKGTGRAATFGDRVSIHYRGYFPGGKQFDSSYDRGQPMSVTIGQGVIPGFTQGLLGMKKGEKRTVTIPYELAYGEAGRPPVIPPKATLMFDLELVGFETGGQ
jgi:FKBP-type peptidyl-prolyl cis-trans isomerase